ncbi:MAG: signal peptidase I [Lentisphaeria bacterium]|nr:signal peptidase I [Lentisphaeria bacterium]
MILKYLKNRKRKKLLSELVSERRAGDDLFSSDEKAAFDDVIQKLRENPDPEEAVKTAEKAMEKIKLPHSTSYIRNLLDLLLVVGAVAFGLRGLYFQPFRIPTSSMQPTLYGIHYQELGEKVHQLPSFLRGLLFANTRAKAVVTSPGRLDPESLKHKTGLLFDRTEFTIGNKVYSLPGDPVKVADYALLDPQKEYQPGDVLADGCVALGDHLFVERFSIYLVPPQRGEVMVFTTENLFDSDGTPLEASSGHYYIKRLVALPGDTIKLLDNQLYIRPAGEKEFKKAQAFSPRFEKVYSGKGGYQGHLSDMGVEQITSGSEFTVPAGHYFMLGDNSRFSKDSRFFGFVPRRNLVGRAFITFWPFSRRWGLIDNKEPLDVPTGNHRFGTFPVMYKQ